MLRILTFCGALQGPVTPDTVAIGLEEATRRAMAVSPLVAAASGEIQRPRGLRAEAAWPFPDNPTITYGRIRRRSPGDISHDREWSVSQDIEIAGQWIVRRGAASALIRSAEARAEDARRLTALEARRVYLELAIAERRQLLTDSTALFGERLARFARRQFEAGEINRLELNAATLEAARARSAAERARAETQAAAADLGRVLAVQGDTVLKTIPLPEIPQILVDHPSIIALASARRPDLRARQELYAAATRSQTAARLSAIPNLSLGVVGGQEGGTDALLGFTLGVRVPLFYRGQAARGSAQADRIMAQAEEEATERAIAAEITAASTGFARTRAAAELFATEVLGAAAENVALTERSLSEGEATLTEVIVLRRTAVEAQLEYLDVLRASYSAWFDLAAAVAATPEELPALLRSGER